MTPPSSPRHRQDRPGRAHALPPWRSAASLLVLGLGIALPLATRAAEPSPWQLSVSAGTDVPLQVGARLTLEGPARLRLSTTAGFMPAGYAGLLNDTLRFFGAYDERTGELVEAALEDVFLWRWQLGWRPFAESGFHFDAGFMLAFLGGGLTGAQAVAAVTGQPLPSGDGRTAVEASADLQLLTAELGYEWSLSERLRLQFALGGFVTVRARSDLSARDGFVTGLALEPLLLAGEEYLDDVLRRYAHGGYVGLYLGYRLF